MGARRANSVMEAALAGVQSRLNQLLETKNTNVNAVYGSDKSTARTVYNQLGGKTTMTLDTVLSLIGMFPDVSTEWVIRGVGKMVIEPRKISNEKVVNLGDGNVTATGNGKIENVVKEANIDYKESYLIMQGELREAKAKLAIYEPVAKKALGLE